MNNIQMNIPGRTGNSKEIWKYAERKLGKRFLKLGGMDMSVEVLLGLMEKSAAQVFLPHQCLSLFYMCTFSDYSPQNEIDVLITIEMNYKFEIDGCFFDGIILVLNPEILETFVEIYENTFSFEDNGAKSAFYCRCKIFFGREPVLTHTELAVSPDRFLEWNKVGIDENDTPYVIFGRSSHAPLDALFATFVQFTATKCSPADENRYISSLKYLTALHFGDNILRKMIASYF